MHENVEKIMITEQQLAARIAEMAKELDRLYEGRKPVAVCILKGSIMFFADLLRKMNTAMEMDFMVVSSYGSGTVSSRELMIKKDLSIDISGRDVLLIEDIVD